MERFEGVENFYHELPKFRKLLNIDKLAMLLRDLNWTSLMRTYMIY